MKVEYLKDLIEKSKKLTKGIGQVNENLNYRFNEDKKLIEDYSDKCIDEKYKFNKSLDELISDINNQTAGKKIRSHRKRNVNKSKKKIKKNF